MTVRCDIFMMNSKIKILRLNLCHQSESAMLKRGETIATFSVLRFDLSQGDDSSTGRISRVGFRPGSMLHLNPEETPALTSTGKEE
jgi:hypothetical protein